MYTVKPTSKFQKDLKRVQRHGYDIDLLTEVVEMLAAGETLDARLASDLQNFRQCTVSVSYPNRDAFRLVLRTDYRVLTVFRSRRSAPTFLQESSAPTGVATLLGYRSAMARGCVGALR